MGKLAPEELRNILGCIKKNKQVLVPPLMGYDSGVYLLGDKCVVVSTDPCIGVPEEWFGWLLIHYAASDVALFGAKPERWLSYLIPRPSEKNAMILKKNSTRFVRNYSNYEESIERGIVTGKNLRL